MDEVFLSGGSTRIPKIYDIFFQHFDRDKLHDPPHVDGSVTEGAAALAAKLDNTKAYLENWCYYDITPFALGIATSDGTVTEVLRRGNFIPWKCPKFLVTADSEEDFVDVVLMEMDNTCSPSGPCERRHLDTKEISRYCSN